MSKSYRSLKLACYTTNLTMSVLGNISPLLFVTFRELYGISYSMLGLLVLINFATQLIIDLIFSFFSHKFNIARTVKLAPVFAFIGLIIYTIVPMLSADLAYVGIFIGTLIFALSGGLCEVLISPVIAAIPSEDPDREMSKLHSVYAWGVVPVIIITTLFLLIFEKQNWYYLMFFYMIIPLSSALFFFVSDIPQMKTPEKISGALNFLKSRTLWLCVAVIFLGGAAECTMSQWASSYLERAIKIPKVIGDALGVSLFALMLGLGRTLYSKFGKNVYNVLLLGSLGAFFGYVIAALTEIPAIALAACTLTGLSVSMLWPGSLIVSADRFEKSGVFIYAMMAAGGDLGAAAVPQLVGIVADAAIRSEKLIELSVRLGISSEQLGMKLGILIGSLFPLIAIPVILRLRSKPKK